MEIAKKNQILMLRDRGYNIPERELLWATAGGAAPVIPEYSGFYSSESGNPPPLYVLYVPSDVTSDGRIKDVSQQTMIDALHPVVQNYSIGVGLRRLVLISDPLNARADEALLSMLSSDSLTIERFLYDQLIVNPTKHNLAPKYDLIPQADVKAFLEGTKSVYSSFPRMSVSDPVAKWHGAKRGDVFRVTRLGIMSTEPSICYRGVW
jgi:DNA-directed RNA polymerase I, II, and III subunit RPABC1